MYRLFLYLFIPLTIAVFAGCETLPTEEAIEDMVGAPVEYGVRDYRARQGSVSGSYLEPKEERVSDPIGPQATITF